MAGLRKIAATKMQDAFPTNESLQHLLRAEATFRQIQVAFAASGGGGGAGAAGA